MNVTIPGYGSPEGGQRYRPVQMSTDVMQGTGQLARGTRSVTNALLQGSEFIGALRDEELVKREEAEANEALNTMTIEGRKFLLGLQQRGDTKNFEKLTSDWGDGYIKSVLKNVSPRIKDKLTLQLENQKTQMIVSAIGMGTQVSRGRADSSFGDKLALAIDDGNEELALSLIDGNSRYSPERKELLRRKVQRDIGQKRTFEEMQGLAETDPDELWGRYVDGDFKDMPQTTVSRLMKSVQAQPVAAGKQSVAAAQQGQMSLADLDAQYYGQGMNELDYLNARELITVGNNDNLLQRNKQEAWNWVDNAPLFEEGSREQIEWEAAFDERFGDGEGGLDLPTTYRTQLKKYAAARSKQETQGDSSSDIMGYLDKSNFINTAGTGLVQYDEQGSKIHDFAATDDALKNELAIKAKYSDYLAREGKSASRAQKDVKLLQIARDVTGHRNIPMPDAVFAVSQRQEMARQAVAEQAAQNHQRFLRRQVSDQRLRMPAELLSDFSSKSVVTRSNEDGDSVYLGADVLLNDPRFAALYEGKASLFDDDFMQIVKDSQVMVTLANGVTVPIKVAGIVEDGRGIMFQKQAANRARIANGYAPGELRIVVPDKYLEPRREKHRRFKANVQDLTIK